MGLRSFQWSWLQRFPEDANGLGSLWGARGWVVDRLDAVGRQRRGLGRGESALSRTRVGKEMSDV